MFALLAVDCRSTKNQLFLYKVPERLEKEIGAGLPVRVKFAGRPAIAYVVELKKTHDLPPELEIKEIESVIEDAYPLPTYIVQLAVEVSVRFNVSVMDILRASIPKTGKLGFNSYLTLNPEVRYEGDDPEIKQAIVMLSGKRKKRMRLPGMEQTVINKLKNRNLAFMEYELKKKSRKLKESSDAEETSQPRPADLTARPLKKQEIQLTTEQIAALQQVAESIENQKQDEFLLWGVTGSGKTEVYKRAADHALRAGKKAIILVPEIALTSHIFSDLLSYFGDRIAIIHSGLTEKEQKDNWLKILNGEAKVVLGTRMAVFMSLDDVGLIILDEEHDTSYKQTSNPRYHARTVARIRARIQNAALLLGSATPSLETQFSVKTNNILRLNERVNKKPLPEIHLIDMRKQTEKSIFSREMIEALTQAVNEDGKAMVFMNRRGFSKYLMCYDCGFVQLCPRCSITLTYHMDDNLLKCHYCELVRKVSDLCPKCSGRNYTYKGTGVQRVEKELQDLFEGVTVLRMDSDSTKRKNSQREILERFKTEEKAILTGTQMIAKGFHFPEVSMVGVVNADTLLNLADFRSAERTFQLLCQFSGRSGRGLKRGKVVLQTYNPENYAIQSFAEGRVDDFYKKELAAREEAGYPPYRELINIIVSCRFKDDASRVSELLKSKLADVQQHIDDMQILGPAPCPIHKISGNYRFHVLVKIPENKLAGFLPRYNEAVAGLGNLNKKGIRIITDIEPSWLL